jgi:hypothetical protein
MQVRPPSHRSCSRTLSAVLRVRRVYGERSRWMALVVDTTTDPERRLVVLDDLAWAHIVRFLVVSPVRVRVSPSSKAL